MERVPRVALVEDHLAAPVPVTAQMARQVREVRLGHAGEQRAAPQQGGVAGA